MHRWSSFYTSLSHQLPPVTVEAEKPRSKAKKSKDASKAESKETRETARSKCKKDRTDDAADECIKAVLDLIKTIHSHL